MRALIAAAAFALAALPAAGQRDFSKVEITTRQVAPGLYVLEGAGGNMAVSVGDDAVFLVDDNTGLFRFAAGAGPSEALATVRVTEGDPARFASLVAACEDDVVELVLDGA